MSTILQKGFHVGQITVARRQSVTAILCDAAGMKLMTLSAAVAASVFVLFTAPQANAATECTWDGVPVIVNILGTVNFICGDGNSVVHTTTVTVDPSIQFDPHLLTPAP